MHMPALTRRTQLLLDEERYRALEEEARVSGRSVASIVREAIDARLGEAERTKRRYEAGMRLLAAPPPHHEREPEWAEAKGRLYDERWRRMYGGDE